MIIEHHPDIIAGADYIIDMGAGRRSRRRLYSRCWYAGRIGPKQPFLYRKFLVEWLKEARK